MDRALNLPKGLSISRSGVISGTPVKTATALTSKVTVTAADASGAKGSASFTMVVAPDLAAGYSQTTGQVAAVFTSMCLDDTDNAAADGTKAEFAPCATSAEQQWALVPDAAPDGSQTLQIHSKCLDTAGTASGSALELATCNGSAGETWSLEQGEGTLTNPATGLCLTDPNSGATAALAAEIFNCAANPAAGGSTTSSSRPAPSSRRWARCAPKTRATAPFPAPQWNSSRATAAARRAGATSPTSCSRRPGTGHAPGAVPDRAGDRRTWPIRLSTWRTHQSR